MLQHCLRALACPLFLLKSSFGLRRSVLPLGHNHLLVVAPSVAHSRRCRQRGMRLLAAPPCALQFCNFTSSDAHITRDTLSRPGRSVLAASTACSDPSTTTRPCAATSAMASAKLR